MRIKYNDDNDYLYCNECKEIIQLGERYAKVREVVLDEKITKDYHIDCTPIIDEINTELDLNAEANEDLDDFNEDEN